MDNILDDIFSAKEEDIETFSDVIGKNSPPFAPNEVVRLKKTANFREERQKFVEIQHGTHEEDYIWHIKPFHPKKPWAVSIDRVVFAIAKILHELLPHDVQITTFLPAKDWEIEVITIKAHGALNHWSIRDEDCQKVTGQMFEILNTLI